MSKPHDKFDMKALLDLLLAKATMEALEAEGGEMAYPRLLSGVLAHNVSRDQFRSAWDMMMENGLVTTRRFGKEVLLTYRGSKILETMRSGGVP